MAPKPKPARFVFTVGMALAMALTILTSTADRDLAAPIDSLVRGEPEASSPPRPESTRSQAILCAVRVTR